MSLSYTINNIVNKLFRLIERVEYYTCDQEELNYKLSRVITSIDNILKQDNLKPIEGQRENLQQIKFKLDSLQITLVGVLSFNTKQNVIKILKQVRAQFKGLYAIVLAEESRNDEGELDDSYYELFEPFVDIETGYVVEEEDIQVRDACASHIFRGELDTLDNVLNDCTNELAALSLEYQQTYRTTIDEVDIFLAADKAKQKRDKRISKTTQRFFSPSDKDEAKLTPHVTKSVAIRKDLEGVDKHNNFRDFNSREIVLTMLMAIKQLKAEGVLPKKSEEYLDFSEHVSVRMAHMPSNPNLSNVFINHLGAYGNHNKKGNYDSTAVLSIFHKVCEIFGKEKLIKIMLQFGKNPGSITLEFLGLQNSSKNQTFLRTLVRALTLVFQAEIWRYLPIDLNEQGLSNEQVRNISFAMGLAEGLELLEEEIIESEDLFDTDAPLGLPTGKKILHSYELIKTKQESLQSLVQKNLIESSTALSDFKLANPQAEFVCSKNTYTQKLERTFGHK